MNFSECFGLAGTTPTTINNVIAYSWGEVSSTGDKSVVPVFTMASINPIAFRSTHKYLEGEFSLLGYGDVVFATYYHPSAPNSIMPLAFVGTEVSTGNRYKESFDTAYISGFREEFTKDGDNPIVTYTFVAKSCSVSAYT